MVAQNSLNNEQDVNLHRNYQMFMYTRDLFHFATSVKISINKIVYSYDIQYFQLAYLYS